MSRKQGKESAQAEATSAEHVDESFLRCKAEAEALGLSGKELRDYVLEQRQAERDAKEKQAERDAEERQAERDAKEKSVQAEREERQKRAERDYEHEENQAKLLREERQAERTHELESMRVRSETYVRPNENGQNRDSGSRVKLSFLEDHDDIESYLAQFERVATMNDWKRENWGCRLAPLLKGKSREVFVQLPVGESADYESLKKALLHRCQVNATTYRQKFRNAVRKENEEAYVQWDRLDLYLTRWIELTGKEESDLKEMLLMERFLETQSLEEARFIRERNPKNRREVIQCAELFEETRMAEKKYRDRGTLLDAPRLSHPTIVRGSGQNNNPRPLARTQMSIPNQSGFQGRQNNGPPTFQRKPITGCFKCGGQHFARDCHVKVGNRTAIVRSEMSPMEKEMRHTTPLCEKCSKIPYNPSCTVSVEGIRTTAIRDTGANRSVVSKHLVPDHCFTGKTQRVTLAHEDATHELPTAVVMLDTPYFKSKTEVIVMDKPIAPVLIGNYHKHEDKCVPIPAYPSLEVIAPVHSHTTGNADRPIGVKTTPIGRLTPTEIKEAQAKDPSLQKAMDKARQGDPGFQRSNGLTTRFVVKKGILKRMVKTEHDVTHQVVVPKTYRREILRIAHDIPMSGHLAVKATKNRIWSAFYWPGMDTDVRNYCISCDTCQRCASKGSIRRAPLQSIPLVSTPFKRVGVDIVGPINPPSENGNKYILTMIDYATKYPEATAIANTDSVTVAEALLDMWTRLGIPEQIVSDRGAQFTSQLMKEIHRLLQIRGITTTPYHAQANGAVERFNGTLKNMVKRLCTDRKEDWEKHIPALLFAYREVPQESTKFSPFELLFGRTPRGPMQVLKECWTNESTTDDMRTSAEYVTELRNRMEKVCEIARENQSRASRRQKQHYDRCSRERKLVEQDKVLLLLPEKQNRLKLSWKGPYTVLKVLNNVDYVIVINGKERVYHVNLLKKYYEREETETIPTGDNHVAVVMEETEESDMKSEHIPVIPLIQTETYDDVQYAETLNNKQLSELTDLVRKRKTVFSDLPGKTDLAECEIKLTTNEPTRVHQYPIPHSQTQTIEKEVEEMLKMDVIEHATSPYNAPIVLVKKKDGDVRFCVDYRQLNLITVFDAEPIPDVDGIFAKLSKAKYYSKIDLSKGFWQIPMKEEDRTKTAFSTPHGQFQWKKMPFGMKNASAVFSRMMRKLLSNINSDNVHNFMDDILIATETWEDHVTGLTAVFERLLQANLTAKPSKCFLGFRELPFLGHQIGNGKMRPENDKVEKLQKAEKPKTKKQVRSFLGLAGYYRKFVPNFAEIAKPLTDLTKKGEADNVRWTDMCEKSFTDLKKTLTSGPIVILPDKEKEYVLRTDASSVGIGAVLLQESEGMLQPVAYASKKLNAAEKNYSTIERECLGIVWGIKKFETYLYGTTFILETDHRPLQYLKKTKTDNGRLMRWALQLQQYTFTLRIIPGEDNVGADFMSRLE